MLAFDINFTVCQSTTVSCKIQGSCWINSGVKSFLTRKIGGGEYSQKNWVVLAKTLWIVLDVTGHSPLGRFRTTFYNFFFYWVSSEVSLYKAPQAAATSPFLISPTHPTHTWRDRPPHRELRPLMFSTSAWVL